MPMGQPSPGGFNTYPDNPYAVAGAQGMPMGQPSPGGFNTYAYNPYADAGAQGMSMGQPSPGAFNYYPDNPYVDGGRQFVPTVQAVPVGSNPSADGGAQGAYPPQANTSQGLQNAVNKAMGSLERVASAKGQPAANKAMGSLASMASAKGQSAANKAMGSLKRMASAKGQTVAKKAMGSLGAKASKFNLGKTALGVFKKFGGVDSSTSVTEETPLFPALAVLVLSIVFLVILVRYQNDRQAGSEDAEIPTPPADAPEPEVLPEETTAPDVYLSPDEEESRSHAYW